MATISNIYSNWCLEELRGSSQVNQSVWLAWFKKGLLIFEKMVLEYVSGMQNVSNTIADIHNGISEYTLPLGESGIPDFYSVIQLRVAYRTDKDGNPVYHVCRPINLTDYNINPANGRQKGEPMVWKRLSKKFPGYHFISKNKIKIYPTPDVDVENGLAVSYNYMIDVDGITMSTNPNTLNLPRYFFDAIEDYITFRLYQAENPEMAQWYYQQFESTLHDNIYGLNKDKRPVDEGFADLRYFYHY